MIPSAVGAAPSVRPKESACCTARVTCNLQLVERQEEHDPSFPSSHADSSARTLQHIFITLGGPQAHEHFGPNEQTVHSLLNLPPASRLLGMTILLGAQELKKGVARWSSQNASAKELFEGK
jgi:hypothetical protein